MKPKLHLQENGKYKVDNVDRLSYTYFPLTNFKSVKSVITPSMNGSMTIDQNSFLLLPTSNEDSHNSFMNRNVYFNINNKVVWSVTGNTPYQMLHKDKVSLEADFLLHKITRNNDRFKVVVESFVPMEEVYQELHKITFTNTSKEAMKIKPVVSVPLYSRSADNIRDHRHVTSLLNKATIKKNGLTNKPTFSFDERGHILNDLSYSVYSYSSQSIKRYWPILEEFIGEGNNLLDPLVVKEDIQNNYKPGDIVSGYELTGGFEYDEIELNENEEFTVILSLVIDQDGKEVIVDENSFNRMKNETKKQWNKELENLEIKYSDSVYNGWLKWVSIQPIFRRIYGNSFLPQHDYGRGGRGWRDLWQDLLALILMNPTTVRESLLNNFQGVRIDGSNATIIGENPGEFVSDRNNIARVWMDHGSWPLITTKLYLDKVEDIDFLFEEIPYFNDKFTHYTKKVNNNFNADEAELKNKDNRLYKGTVLEHLVIQNLVPYYNVGKHNSIRLEDADWNDGLDMAHQNGESVAFTCMYADNLVELANILRTLNSKGKTTISLLKEIDVLLQNVDYNNINNKHNILTTYFDAVAGNVDGESIEYDSLELALKLEQKGNQLKEHIRNNEWLSSKEYSWYNGYYDDDSKRLDNVENGDMTLTGQVFSIMGNVATDDQIKKIVKAADHYLFDEAVAGYKLNTDFNEVKTNMGRLFGFAYGHKENGAMFSHMSVMYANALYKRGFAHEGHKVLNTIYKHCINIEKSKMYPGIPEYVDPKGRGMYPFLTGSASWFILTEVTEVFGIKGNFGKLIIEPKLLRKQFSNGKASIKTMIQNKLVEIEIHNPLDLEFNEYHIEKVIIEDREVSFDRTRFGVQINESIQNDRIKVYLNGK